MGVVPGRLRTKEAQTSMVDMAGYFNWEQRLHPRELIHISIPIVLGAGSLEVVDKDFFVNNPADSEFTVENSVFFVAEPGIEIEFNITEVFPSRSWCLLTGIFRELNLENVKDEDVSGTTALISFRFGRF